MSVSVFHINENQYTLSVLFVVQYALVLYTIWVISNRRVGIFLLFMLTCGFFLGGRFFAVFLGLEDKNLFEGTFFAPEQFSWDIGICWFNFMTLFLCVSLIGYQSGVSNTSASPLWLSKFNNISIDNMLDKLFYFFLLFVLISRITALKLVSAENYLALYQHQSEAYSTSFSPLVNTIFLSFCGLAVAYGNSYNKKRYLCLFLLSAVATVIAGQRGSLGGAFLILVWLVYRNKNISLMKIFLIAGLALLCLLTFSALSLRSTYDFTLSNKWLILLNFLFDQGITFAVFGESTNISYTWLHYYGSITPGAGSMLRLFQGHDIWSYDFSFPDHLANSLNPELYSSGMGLGWSILSDLYVYAFKLIPIYVILCWLFGYIIARWEVRLKDCKFIYAMFIAVSPVFFLLARSPSATLVRYLFWFLICFFICFVFRDKKSSLYKV